MDVGEEWSNAAAISKNPSQQRSWMVTMLRIAVEWDITEHDVLQGMPDGTVDERKKWETKIEEAYGALARLDSM